MEEPKILIDLIDEPNRNRAGWVKRIPPWLVLVLVPVLVGIAVFFRQPLNLGSTTDIALFILTALLCTLVAVSLMLARRNQWLRRTEQDNQTMAAQMLAVQDMQTRLCQAMQRSSQEINAPTAQEEGLERLVQDGVARLTGGLQAVASNLTVLRDALQAQEEATNTVLATLTGGHGQLATEVRQLHASIETIAETTRQTSDAVTLMADGQTALRDVTQRIVEELTAQGARQDVLGEALHGHDQANRTALSALTGSLQQLREMTQTVAGAVTGATQEHGAAHSSLREALTAATAALQEGRKTLQIHVEKVAETDRQMSAAVTALTAGHGQSAETEPPPQILAQTTAGGGLPDAAASGPVEKASSPLKLAAAQAVIHGEQMRYEVGPDRDNLGHWANPSDWAQWELEIPQPGRFSLAAEIAALAPGRFHGLVGNEGLAGTAPATGDYGRFQTVELGAVELAAGKTRLAVRPIPEGWQPMNLKSLDLTPVA